MEEKLRKQSVLEKASGSLIKLGGWIGQQKHFSAIRDAFGAFLPLLIVGAMAVMINSVFISETSLLASLAGADSGTALYDSWANVAFYISPLFNGISGATMSLFAVYISFLLGYFLMGSYGGNQLMGGLVGLMAFMLLDPIGANGMLYMGAQGIVFAMITGLTAPMVLWKLQNIRAIQIRMPEGVPPVVAASLNALFPFMITAVIFGAIQPIFGAIMFAAGPGQISGAINPEWYYITNALYKVLVSPFMKAGQSPFMIFVVLFLVGLFWFFGVHGNNVMGPFVNAVWTPMTVMNVALFGAFGNDVFASGWVSPEAAGGIAAGTGLALWTEQTMNSFALMGGASSVLGLLLGLTLFSRIPEQRAIANIATPIACFNISEPTMFGIPVMLNPVYFVPFIFCGAIQGMVAWGATAIGLVNPTVVMVPWTAPLFLSGFLSTLDWRSIILTAVNFGIAFGLYLPFVLADIATQTKIKAKEAEMEVEDYKVVSERQLAEDKIERKEGKVANRIEYKAVAIEANVRAYTVKIDKLNDSLENKIDQYSEAIEISEHNEKIYLSQNNGEKATKEKDKVNKINEKIASTKDKFNSKIEKIQIRLDAEQAILDDLENVQLPAAKKVAEENIEKAKKELDLKPKK